MGGLASTDMGPAKRACALLAALIAAVVVFAPAAQGGSGPGPIAVAACAPKGCTETENLSVPAGGTGMVQTDQLPTKATNATVTVKPQTSADVGSFDRITLVLAKTPSVKKRLLFCLLLYSVGITYGNDSTDITLNEPTLTTLWLNGCIELAATLPVVPPSSGRAAAAGCSQVTKSVAIQISRAGRGYQARLSGMTQTVSGPSAAVITCRRAGAGLQLSIKPRKRGQTLRQIVGSNLGVGLLNRSTAAVRTRTTLVIR